MNDERLLDCLFGAHCILALTDVDPDTCMTAIEFLRKGFINMPPKVIDVQREMLRDLLKDAAKSRMEELN